MPADRISQCLGLLLIVGCQAENCDLQRYPTVIRIVSAIIRVCRDTFTVRAGILIGILKCQLKAKLQSFALLSLFTIEFEISYSHQLLYPGLGAGLGS